MKSKLKKHYLFYMKNELELYAYTEDPDLAKAFEDLRDMKKFYKKEVSLNSSERKELFDLHSECLLSIYPLKGPSSEEFPMPMTSLENLCVTSRASNLLVVQLPLTSEINPIIFTEEIGDALRLLGYHDLYKYSHDPEASGTLSKIFEVNTFYIFLEMYGDTLR